VILVSLGENNHFKPIFTVIHYQKLTYYDFAEILIGLTTARVLFSL
jgi:hypothetical protein